MIRGKSKNNSFKILRYELEKIIDSLSDGIIFTDKNGFVELMNNAAKRMLRYEPLSSEKKNISEFEINDEIKAIIDKAFKGYDYYSNESKRLSDREEFVVIKVLNLNDNNIWQGNVIILQDQTRLKRLEEIRRDFVANVSHELKTPITSIKGFIETLKDGAINDPDNAKKFLDIVSRQADRLNAIIEDLLSLARIEQDAERGEVELENAPLRSTLENAIQLCQQRALEKSMKMEFNCDPNLTVFHNKVLIEQAVVNLVDNAIKYSEPERKVKVEVERSDFEILISVIDEGQGIPKEHLPRIFERFYRVDKARSRKLGGTGLGLSIVKHIAAVHNGSVTVESEVGKGSKFTIHLPNKSNHF